MELKKGLVDTASLENKIFLQQDLISSQRSQLQAFANEINGIKSKLVALNNFEKKIRVVANIANTGSDDVQKGSFGIGGSIPDDLEAGLELSEKHNSLLREMHEHVEQLNVALFEQEKSFESLINHLDEQRNLLAATPAIRPAMGLVTSRFGRRKSPFSGLSEFHKGLDIAARKGTPIVATADGIVTFSGRKGLLGKTLIIDHGYGMVTRYSHIYKFLKKTGDKVKRGERIALIGNSGRSTGPHVHYEVHLKGVPVNPEKYILD